MFPRKRNSTHKKKNSELINKGGDFSLTESN
jgi:hypothetical protein